MLLLSFSIAAITLHKYLLFMYICLMFYMLYVTERNKVCIDPDCAPECVSTSRTGSNV